MMARRRSGVTLIELLVVLSLMAIVSAVTVPAFESALRRDRQLDSSGVVRELLMRARATALARGRAVDVTIDPANARYWVADVDTAIAMQLPSGATLASDRPRVHFRFASSGEATGEPLFVRTGDRVISIAVDELTGAVRADGR